LSRRLPAARIVADGGDPLGAVTNVRTMGIDLNAHHDTIVYVRSGGRFTEHVEVDPGCRHWG
jgi:hypothetical protein